MAFNSLLHSHHQTGEALNSKWAFLRWKFTVCSRNYSKSGQHEYEVFPDFSQGQTIMSYMHCAFKNLPTLDMVLREVGDGIRAKYGLGGSNTVEQTASDRNNILSGEHPKRVSTVPMFQMRAFEK